MAIDRAAFLAQSTAITGIDYIHVEPSQTELWVYFLNDPDDLVVNFIDVPLTPAQVEIVSVSGGESVAVVPVVSAAQVPDPDGASTHVLKVITARPGDFSRYRLTIIDPVEQRVDLFFNGVEFSFKADCKDTNLDCAPPPLSCPPDELVDFPIDYLARDFDSYRRALLDFARQRYPDWRESIEADQSVMLMELMAALGDELSYIQDRVAREGYLESATQRRSVRRLARLVDYELHDGRSGATLLRFNIGEGAPQQWLVAGERVWSVADDGVIIPFEVGERLRDALGEAPLFEPKTFPVDPTWNGLDDEGLAAHIFDESATCLDAGATELFLVNDPSVNELGAWQGKWILLASDPSDPADPRRRVFVYVTDAVLVQDVVLDLELIKLTWSEEQATTVGLGLDDLRVFGNIVPATAGARVTEYFRIGAPGDADPIGVPEGTFVAVEREGPLDAVTTQRSITHLHSLRAAEAGGLGRVGQELRETLPELRVIEVDTPLEDGGQVFGPEWLWRRSLLNSFPYERHFTLDDGTWRRVIGFQRPNADDDFEHVDYASGDGQSVRFGDGEFARIPGPVWLRADYRRGPGAASNVPAGAITTIVDPALEGEPPPVFAAADVLAVDNPQPVQSGVDPESVEQARQLAPEEFRAIQHRALRPADFCEIAEREPWVERAGASFRWTGSWLTGFVTPDPRDSFEMSAEQRASLEGVLDCARQAGREVFLSDPRYRPLDLEVTICVRPGSLPSEVRNAVRVRLLGDARTAGYFGPERFTFGTPLVRLTIEGIVGAVRGVLAVLAIRVGARGIHPITELPGTYAVPKDQILRLANDPRFPERGSLKVFIATEAGA